jgi:hypothetical protein
MDKGMGRSSARVGAGDSPARVSNQPAAQQEFEGVVRNGKVELVNGTLAEGTRVQLRIKK